MRSRDQRSCGKRSQDWADPDELQTVLADRGIGAVTDRVAEAVIATVDGREQLVVHARDAGQDVAGLEVRVRPRVERTD